MYKLGLHKSPYDKRDFLYKSFVKYEGLPLKFSIRNKMSPVRNQGQEGSCAGHAGANAKEFQEMIDLQKSITLSPRYIYEYAKEISGHEEGTTLKAIVKVLLKKGICEEKYWPYIANDPDTPSSFANENAEKYRIKGYARITNLEELKIALHTSYPKGGAIIAGLLLYKGAVGEEAQKTGITPNPSCWDEWRNGAIGGHALEPCGWNDESPYYKNDGHIVFKGSWGDNFGDKGYHYFSYKNVRANMLDCFALVDIEGSKDILNVASLSKYEKYWV